MKNEPQASYLHLCPVHGEEEEISFFKKTGLCRKDYARLKVPFWRALASGQCDQLGQAKSFCEVETKLKAYLKFFKKNFGFAPFTLNRYWAKRVLSGQSFSIMAPTGFGKTTFGTVIAHVQPGKVYYLVPTKILLREIRERLERIKSKKRLLVADDKLQAGALEAGDYDILLTTSAFLHRHFDAIPKSFDLVFVDDADSLIRQPRNIDKLLTLIGFSEDDITRALDLIDRKRKAHRPEQFIALNKERITNEPRGQVIAASATLSPRTKRIHLFRELLGFEIGLSSTTMRNITDAVQPVARAQLFDQAIAALKQLGRGAFVFLSDDFSKDELQNFLNQLDQAGIKALSYERFSPRNREKFKNGEIEAFVGFSSLRNPLTRGIDLPQAIRYALFVGVPKLKLPLKPSYSPRGLFLLLTFLREFIQADHPELYRMLAYLKRVSFLKEEQVLENPIVKSKVEPVKQALEQILQDSKLIDRIRAKHNLDLIEQNGTLFLLVSDPRGYLQASGRTSRLFPLGLTRGFSLVLSENPKVFHNLGEKLQMMGYRVEFKPVNEIDLNKLFQQIDHDRKIVLSFLRGETTTFVDPIRTALVVVESPTKARTIANFFGRPARRRAENSWVYEVSIGNVILNIVATVGHFVDLVHAGEQFGVLKEGDRFIARFQPLRACVGCRRALDQETVCPVCGDTDITSKRSLIDLLRNLAAEVEEVYLCTDPDTEGEKISFDLEAFLQAVNRKIKRIEIHELTRYEFLRQFQQPRQVKRSLVAAQFVRRISDRWTGFSLSAEVQDKFRNLALSAGRVQTPVLGWIIEREERRKHKSYFIRVTAGNGDNQLAETFWLPGTAEAAFDPTASAQAKAIVAAIKRHYKAGELMLTVKPGKSNRQSLTPPPPFDTSDLLRDASAYLRLDARTTMATAQTLFERGLITYHRTDSRFVSDFGRRLAADMLERKELAALSSPRSWGRPGTHECIRPTKHVEVQDIIDQSLENNEQIPSRRHLALYGLIFNRFLASQMLPAKVRRTNYQAKLSVGKETFPNWPEKEESVNSEILEYGFLKILPAVRLRSLSAGSLPVTALTARRVSREAPFTEGSLIDLMKRRGLGRPSTYSSILQTIKDRGYVITRRSGQPRGNVTSGTGSSYLFPTTIGIEVFQHLNTHHHDLVGEEFTKQLEGEMDRVEHSRADYQQLLGKLYERIFK